jgi:hypothetical protein
MKQLCSMGIRSYSNQTDGFFALLLDEYRNEKYIE